jgi:galactokinase
MNVESGKLKEAFRAVFDRDDAQVYRAPGRVNLIGEHTDYNDGFVMPAAIDFYVWVAIAPRVDRKIAVYSANYGETAEFDFDEQDPQAKGHWSDYPRGVARMLKLSGLRLGGADLLVRGDVPVGAGLSSSAALEVAVGFALLGVSGISIEMIELAQLCQKAENEFVGARCGLMDQFAACFGRVKQALFLDCRSLDHRPLCLPSDTSLVVCNTMVKHDLAAGEYNDRRAECEDGVRILSRSLPNVKALRDVTFGDLETAQAELTPKVFKRCAHVVRENERVLKAAELLEDLDPTGFGELMYESHQSLRDDYEVSCPELDAMVEIASGLDGIYGARMTGGGFGGCTVNLVQTPHVESFKNGIENGYMEKTGIRPDVYVVKPVDGVERAEAETTQLIYQGA